MAGSRVTKFWGPHMTRVAMKRSRTDKHGIGAASQKSHDKTVLGTAAAYLCAARALGYLVGNNAIDRLHEVGDDIGSICFRKREISIIELAELRRQILLVSRSLPFIQRADQQYRGLSQEYGRSNPASAMNSLTALLP